MPAFIQREPLGRGRAWRVRYSEDDLNVVVAEEPVDPQTTGLEDGLDGAGSAEIILTKLLTEGQVGAS
jgi:hypothetical protein